MANKGNMAATNIFVTHCEKILNLSIHTVRAYTSDLHDFKRFIDGFDVDIQIQKDTIREYINYLREVRQLKETSLKRKLATLKVFFSWLHDEEVIAASPFEGFKEKIRIPQRLPKALDKRDLKKLRGTSERTEFWDDSFDALTKRLCIALLVETGMRVGELVGAELDNLNLAEQSLRIIGKGNKERKVYIFSKEILADLKEYVNLSKKFRGGHSLILTTPQGKPYSTQRIRRHLHDLSKAAGITKNITPHMLRHTSATLWLESGIDIRYVQKLLGHQSISTTEIYAHASEDGVRKALLRTQKNRRFYE